MYESLRGSGVLPPATMAFFDADGEEQLYELRFLSVKQRVPAAEYIAERGLGPDEAKVCVDYRVCVCVCVVPPDLNLALSRAAPERPLYRALGPPSTPSSLTPPPPSPGAGSVHQGA